MTCTYSTMQGRAAGARIFDDAWVHALPSWATVTSFLP